MPRPKFYRDPVHLQLRYDAADLSQPISVDMPDMRISWLVRKLVDCKEFQRLRHIRQNGLTNLVFHGAEHSRFAHSMGAAYLAREMYRRIERNSDSNQCDGHFAVTTCVAALLHDVGHGPFSHTLEEILRNDGIEFDHEEMTQRFIDDDESSVNAVLRSVDPALPAQIVYYISKKRREKAQEKDHWRFRLVSSQLDADRLEHRSV